MFCKYCGNQLKENAKFCEHCGSAVAGSQYVESVQSQQTVTEKPSDAPKGLAIAGFVCSFFAPLVGLILCCVALRKYKTSQGQECRTMAKAGVIISIIGMVVTVIILIAYAAMIAELASMYGGYYPYY